MKFDHVSDEGIRNYLTSDPDPKNYTTSAAQLDAAFALLTKARVLRIQNIEGCWSHYEDACDYFGVRNLQLVHASLQRFWAAAR